MSMTTESGTITRIPLTSDFGLARVDLLPPEVIADRRFKRARGWMALAVVGTVGLTGGAFALASADADAAAEALAVEQARTVALNAEAAEFAVVPALLAAVERAETALDTAMATDIEWYRYLSQMGTVTPEGVWFTGITLTAAAPVPGATQGSDPLAPVDAVGDVLTVGRALVYEDVATWMDNLSSVSGYDHVMFTNVARTEGEATDPFIDFQVSAKLLPEVYSDRYVPEAE